MKKMTLSSYAKEIKRSKEVLNGVGLKFVLKMTVTFFFSFRLSSSSSSFGAAFDLFRG